MDKNGQQTCSANYNKTPPNGCVSRMIWIAYHDDYGQESRLNCFDHFPQQHRVAET